MINGLIAHRDLETAMLEPLLAPRIYSGRMPVTGSVGLRLSLAEEMDLFLACMAAGEGDDEESVFLSRPSQGPGPDY
jgi:hypothetical protein